MAYSYDNPLYQQILSDNRLTARQQTQFRDYVQAGEPNKAVDYYQSVIDGLTNPSKPTTPTTAHSATKATTDLNAALKNQITKGQLDATKYDSNLSDLEQWIKDNLWTADSIRRLLSQVNNEQMVWDEQARQYNALEAEKNRLFQQESADKAMAFSREEATRQMEFQERMSSTSYQRAVHDLKAAGLNPILAAGASSSAPSGAMASSASASGSAASQSPSSVKMAQLTSNLGDLLKAAGDILDAIIPL